MNVSCKPLRPAALAAAASLLSLLGTTAPATIAEAQRTPAAAQTAPKATLVTTVEGISEYSLPNGLRVLLFPDQSKPTVTVNITYLVGSRHEGYGETGMAHLLEHLLFKGSKNHPNIPKELTDRGSRPNGTTWYDRTNYFETVPATEDNLAWALDLEADRMVNSFVSQADLESEFSVVRNEFEAGENSPFRVTLERVMSAAYRWHGYGRSTIGNKSDIENVPIDRLQAFYRRYYQPDNAVLVVAGKLDVPKTLALIEDKFGRIPRPVRTAEAGNIIHATYTEEPTQDGERSVIVRRVGDAQLLWVGYRVPAGSHPDFAAVSVLAHALTNNPSGRLYSALVERRLASSVSGFAFQLKEPGMLHLSAQLRMEQSLDSARRVMQQVLDTARTFTAEEVDRAKTSMLRNIELTLNNSEWVGYELTEWASRGDWRLFFLHRDRIEQVTPADVQRVAAAYLKPANRTVAQFIPTSAPDRAEIPPMPNVNAMVANYRGREEVHAGEAFDASPANIDARTARSRLPNGMHLSLLRKETRGNRVVAQIVLRHGTEESLTGRTQVGALAVAMLSRGTTELTRQQVRDSIDKLKAQVFIGGATNNVNVSIETLRENFIPVLDLVAQQLRSPRFDPAEFETLKRERLASIEQSKSEPQVLANVALQRRLTPKPKGHILYASMPEEMIEDITSVTLDQVREFHRRFYGATYADMAVIGAFDEAEVRAAAARLFGDWRNPQPFARAVRTYAALDSAFESIETPDKANAVFRAGQNLEVRDDDPDYPALVIGNFMFGSGFLNSRLATRLRQKEGLSYGVGTSLIAQSLDRYGTFTAFAIYAPQNADRLVAAFREEIDRVLAEGFTAEEVAAAKTGYIQGRSQSRANDGELVGTLVARRFTDRTMAWDAEFERAVATLTPAQVNAVIRKHVDPKRIVLVRAGDFKNNPPARPTP
ncbi:MAG TPA: pitrilysin family protein [Gemmatimonadaceae bacterium]|nr:pitrilysin family protein [Gemmatimonadaceae bacterium]